MAEGRAGLLESYQGWSHVPMTLELTKPLVPPDQTFSHTSSHSIATTDMVLTRRGRVPHSVSLTWGRAVGAGRGRKAPRSLPGDILTRPGSICQKWTPGHIGNKCAMNLATSEKQQCFEVLLASNDPVSGRTV